MQKEENDNFKEFFLLEFTKCLIEESININDVVLEDDKKVVAENKKAEDVEKLNVLAGRVIGNKKSVKKIMSELSREKKSRGRDAVLLRKSRVGGFRSGARRVIKKVSSMRVSPKVPSRKVSSPAGKNRLMIKEPEFAQRLKYIKPVVTMQHIDLGKVNSLIVPPLVKQVDCNGAGVELIIRTNRAKKTKVVLTEDEIGLIIRNFSSLSRIPVSDGVFRAAVGNVEIVAMVSGTVGSKFIIRKIQVSNNGFRRRV